MALWRNTRRPPLDEFAHVCRVGRGPPAWEVEGGGGRWREVSAVHEAAGPAVHKSLSLPASPVPDGWPFPSFP